MREIRPARELRLRLPPSESSRALLRPQPRKAPRWPPPRLWSVVQRQRQGSKRAGFSLEGDGCDDTEPIAPPPPFLHSRKLPLHSDDDAPPLSDDEGSQGDLSTSDVPPPPLGILRDPFHPLANALKNDANVPFRSAFPPLRNIKEVDESPFTQPVEGPRAIDPAIIRNARPINRHRRPPNPKPDPPGVRATPRKRVDSWPSSKHKRGFDIWNMIPGPHRDPEEDWFLADDVVGLPLYSDPGSDLDSQFEDETILDSNADGTATLCFTSDDSDDSDWTSTSSTESPSDWDSDLDSLLSDESLLVHSSDSASSDPTPPSTSVPKTVKSKPPPPPTTAFLLPKAMHYADLPPPTTTVVPKPSSILPFLTPRTSNRSLPTLFARLATSSSPPPRPIRKPSSSTPMLPNLDQGPTRPPILPPTTTPRDPPGKSQPRSPSPERRASTTLPPPPEPLHHKPATATGTSPSPATQASPLPSLEDDSTTPSPAKPAINPSVVASQLAIYDDIQKHRRSPPTTTDPDPGKPALTPSKKPSTLFRVGTCLRRLAAYLSSCLARQQDGQDQPLASQSGTDSPSALETCTTSSPESASRSTLADSPILDGPGLLQGSDILGRP